jgi:hypothetical protein
MGFGQGPLGIPTTLEPLLGFVQAAVWAGHLAVALIMTD